MSPLLLNRTLVRGLLYLSRDGIGSILFNPWNDAPEWGGNQKNDTKTRRWTSWPKRNELTAGRTPLRPRCRQDTQTAGATSWKVSDQKEGQRSASAANTSRTDGSTLTCSGQTEASGNLPEGFLPMKKSKKPAINKNQEECESLQEKSQQKKISSENLQDLLRFSAL